MKKMLPIRKKSSSTPSIQTVSLGSLNHHPKNPRDHNEENIQAIIRSLSAFGVLQPIVVWGTQNYVIVGNGRLEAMRRLGKKEAPIIRADHLSEEQAVAYMIADNKTTDMSSFNDSLLAEIMQGISKNDSLLDSTGFNRMELEPLLTSGLPDSPEGFGDVSAPDGVADLEEQGSSKEMQRIILAFDTEEERFKICRLLGLDPVKDTKITFSFSEIPALNNTILKQIPIRRMA